jgi:hypothetical protein
LPEVNTKKHICCYMILYVGLEEEVDKINYCRWHRYPVFCLTKNFISVQMWWESWWRIISMASSYLTVEQRASYSGKWPL